MGSLEDCVKSLVAMWLTEAVIENKMPRKDGALMSSDVQKERGSDIKSYPGAYIVYI